MCPERAWKPLTSSSPQTGPPALCISSIWLFLSCIPYNKLVIVSKVLSWILWAILANYQTWAGSHGAPIYSWLTGSVGSSLGLWRDVWRGAALEDWALTLWGLCWFITVMGAKWLLPLSVFWNSGVGFYCKENHSFLPSCFMCTWICLNVWNICSPSSQGLVNTLKKWYSIIFLLFNIEGAEITASSGTFL